MVYFDHPFDQLPCDIITSSMYVKLGYLSTDWRLNFGFNRSIFHIKWRKPLSARRKIMKQTAKYAQTCGNEI